MHFKLKSSVRSEDSFEAKKTARGSYNAENSRWDNLEVKKYSEVILKPYRYLLIISKQKQNDRGNSKGKESRSTK